MNAARMSGFSSPTIHTCIVTSQPSGPALRPRPRLQDALAPPFPAGTEPATCLAQEPVPSHQEEQGQGSVADN